MRHQPVVTWVTLIATALSVFLIMVVVIMQRINVVPYAPESCRDRLLVGQFLHTYEPGTTNESSAGLSYNAARTLYENLDGVETLSFMESEAYPAEVCGTTKNYFSANMRHADANFFKIFDHTLISGRFYTPDEANAVLPVIVISESTARRAFNTIECIGRELNVNHNHYRVVGVVRDTSPLAKTGSGDIFIATGPTDKDMAWENSGGYANFGPVAAALLVKKGIDFQHVRDQVKARYAILDTQLAPFNLKTIYHEAPYDQETIADNGMMGSNVTPDTSRSRKMHLLIYAILLIVPAINLSSMLHSRIRRRVSELGIRRAYGCTRRRIITDIISENFIVTLAGGIVGLMLGVIFAKTYSGLYENEMTYGIGLTPAMSAVINWGTIFIALGVCFILNIISAAVPAWQASRLNPINAINTK